MLIKVCYFSTNMFQYLLENSIMNYTKTIREFCLQNKADIFDVSYMKDTYFEMAPHKSLLKILNRLKAKGTIACVAKSVLPDQRRRQSS